jgi:hypothetical protein
MQAAKMRKELDALWSEELPLQKKDDAAGSERFKQGLPDPTRYKSKAASASASEPGTEYWLP